EERFEVPSPARTHIGGECRLAILGCVPSEQILHKIGDRDPVDLRRHKLVGARFLHASTELRTRFGLHRGLRRFRVRLSVAIKTHPPNVAAHIDRAVTPHILTTSLVFSMNRSKSFLSKSMRFPRIAGSSP